MRFLYVFPANSRLHVHLHMRLHVQVHMCLVRTLRTPAYETKFCTPEYETVRTPACETAKMINLAKYQTVRCNTAYETASTCRTPAYVRLSVHLEYETPCYMCTLCGWKASTWSTLHMRLYVHYATQAYEHGVFGHLHMRIYRPPVCED